MPEASSDAETPVVWVDRAELAAAASVAAAVVPRSLLDDGYAAQGMWLKVTSDGLELSTRAPELSVRALVRAVPAPVDDPIAQVTSPSPPGRSVVAPARMFARLVPNLRAGPVALGVGADRLVVRSARFRALLRALDPADLLEPLSELAPIWEATIDGESFRDAIDHLAAAVGSVVSWPTGAGGLLIAPVDDDTIDLAVTDRSDVAVASRPAEFIAGDTPVAGASASPVSLPPAMVLALRAVRPRSGPALIRVGADRVAITIGATTVTAVVSLEPVPDHRSLTRIEPTHWMSVARRSLATAMRRVSLLARDDLRSVWFELGHDAAVARAAHPEIGQVSERFAARFTGPNCEIGLGLPRLAAVTDRLHGGRVRIEFADSDKVVCLFSEDRPDLRFYTRLLTVRHRPWWSTDEMREWSPPQSRSQPQSRFQPEPQPPVVDQDPESTADRRDHP